MRELLMDHSPPRFVPTIPGVPDNQTRALDRRHRLERQLRSFAGPDRITPTVPTFTAGTFAIIEEAGPGPA